VNIDRYSLCSKEGEGLHISSATLNARPSLIVPFGANALKESPNIRNHQNTANLTVLGAGHRITADNNFSLYEVTVSSLDARRLRLYDNHYRQETPFSKIRLSVPTVLL
jgi:hypothetical protein